MKSNNECKKPRVVITGMGCVSPLGCSPQDLFENLLSGERNFILSKGVNVSLVDRNFERKYQNFPRSVLYYAVAAIRDAIISSGININDERDLGLYIGASQDLADPNSEEGNILSSIVEVTGIKGECLSLPVACSGGNVAIALAASKIQTGSADIILAGGVERYTDLCFSTFDVLQVLSKQGCSPFAKGRDGITIGEGAGILVLEDFEHAKSRNAPILAEIVGYSIKCDSTHLNTPDQYGLSASLAIREAILRSGINSSEIDCISPHGTGTFANDLQEANAIYSVFGEHSSLIPISAIKSMLGHCMGAASALEAIVSVQSLLTQKIPDTLINDEQDIDNDFPFVPNLRNFKDMSIDYILSNSFAFGGNVACIVLKRIDNESEYQNY